MPTQSSPKVVLVGWDAADWQIIRPLLRRGLMPVLQKFLDGGTSATLATRQPILSPILWNTIATGKIPAKHGILGFVEPNADNTAIQPITSTSRKTKALWNILSQNNLKSTIVGWYASHPAEPINGAIISDLLITSVIRDNPDSPLPPQSFHPPQLADRLADLRLFTSDITAGHVLPFVPDAGAIPLEKTAPLASLQQILARCGTTHAIFTDLLENNPSDFAAVYYEAIDHFGHVFMPYHPPRMPHVPEQEFNWYKGCIESVYRFHDMMLDRTLQLAGPDATVLIISDHGFLNDHLRPKTLRSSENPAAWHRDHGIFAVSGPGIRKAHRIHAASIIDIAPTILALLNLPVGQDMDGKVLLEIFDHPPEIHRIPSWDSQPGPGDPGLHPPDLRVDPYEQSAALQQLVDLGYIALPNADSAKDIADAQQDAQYNLACSELELAPRRALERLEALCAQYPDIERFFTLKLLAQLHAGHFAVATKTIGPEGQNLPALPPEQRFSILAAIAFGQKKDTDAAGYLAQAEKINPDIPALQMQIGDLHARRRSWNAAAQTYTRAVQLDSDSPHAHHGLARAFFHLRDYQRALDHSLLTLELLHNFPPAHLQLALALLHLNLLEQAVKALNVALQLKPNFLNAHRLLAVAHHRLGHAEQSQFHRQVIRHLKR